MLLDLSRLHRVASDVKMICCFAFAISRIAQKQKIRGLVIYLKTCHVLLMQSAAGYRVENITSLGLVKRTRSGIPRIIPAQARVRIREGDIATIVL